MSLKFDKQSKRKSEYDNVPKRTTSLEEKYDTQKLLEKMVGGCKLTKFQRNEVMDTFKVKKSLPSNGIAMSKQQSLDDALLKYKLKQKESKMFVDSNKGRLTSKKKIFEENLYQPDTFIPLPGCDREKEKNILATFNEFGGKDKTPSVIIQTRIDKKIIEELKPKKKEEVDRFNEIQREIDDRIDFLNQMEESGQLEPEQKQTILSQIDDLIQEMRQKVNK